MLVYGENAFGAAGDFFTAVPRVADRKAEWHAVASPLNTSIGYVWDYLLAITFSPLFKDDKTLFYTLRYS